MLIEGLWVGMSEGGLVSNVHMLIEGMLEVCMLLEGILDVCLMLEGMPDVSKVLEGILGKSLGSLNGCMRDVCMPIEAMLEGTLDTYMVHEGLLDASMVPEGLLAGMYTGRLVSKSLLGIGIPGLLT